MKLFERLLEHGYDFDFFQAVRLLGLIANDRPGLGSAEHPSEEVVRFQIRQSLLFPPSAIHWITREDDERESTPPFRMIVSFFGLTGIQGALPLHYTEHIIARADKKDFAMAAFFDLFNHRLISLFYRAWEKHNFPARHQLAAVREHRSDFTRYLASFIGIGTPTLSDRLSVPDEALLRSSGLWAQEPHSAAALELILSDYFVVPIAVEQFIGRWHTIEPEDRCDLGGEGLRNQLGVGAVAGDATWDPQSGIRLRLGPLSLLHYLAFLPNGKAAKRLRDLTRLATGIVPHVEWQPVLRAEEVPWCRLGDRSEIGPRLGWTTWLKTSEFDADASDAVFDFDSDFGGKMLDSLAA